MITIVFNIVTNSRFLLLSLLYNCLTFGKRRQNRVKIELNILSLSASDILI